MRAAASASRYVKQTERDTGRERETQGEKERERRRESEDEEEGEKERERESAPVSKLSSWIALVHLQARVRVRIQYDLNNARSKVNWSSGSKEKYGHAYSQIW